MSLNPRPIPETLAALGGAVAAAVLLAAAPAAGDQSGGWPPRAELRLRFEETEREAPPAASETRAGASSPEAPPPGPPPAGQDVELSPFWKRDPLGTPAPLRGVYDKPFLASLGRKAFLGGYTELEYHAFQDGVLGIPRGFRAHRTNLFAYSDVGETIRFGSEIEFEHEEPGEETEVKVEMAFVDWVIFEELIVRGGAILVPLGRINVNHDGPIRELTSRPLVSTFVIPTTLTEAGIGAHGSFRPGEGWAAGYEAYATNGFRVLDRDGELAAPITERQALLREGRPSLGGDSNKDLASTGRIWVQALSAVELGGSWHVGTYDERSDNLLDLLAADLAVARGPWALEGEIARAGFERDGFARTAGVPDRFWGFYVQGSASHVPGFLKRWAPRVFDREGAALTAVLRYDWIDLAGDRAEAIEPGINFRPFADTVFKFSYRFGLKSLGIRGVPGREGFDDDGFVFSLATYF